MSILSHFKPVPTMTTDEVRSFLEEHGPEEYNLVDVRQPGEYTAEHIPGTKLIPLGELEGPVGRAGPDQTHGGLLSGGRPQPCRCGDPRKERFYQRL